MCKFLFYTCHVLSRTDTHYCISVWLGTRNSIVVTDSCVHRFVVCCLNQHSQNIVSNYTLFSSPPLTSTTNTASTASTVPVPLSPSPATPTPPPPGLPSPALAHSTLGGYNNGVPWTYTTGQDATVPSSGIGGPTNQLHFSNQGSVQYHPGVWNVPQDPRPPNQPSPRGVTPAQRSPYPGDGMVNPQHGEGGPRPAGVGTFNGGNGGNGATGMNFSQAVSGSGSGSGHDIAVTAQPHSSTHQTGIVTWLN